MKQSKESAGYQEATVKFPRRCEVCKWRPNTKDSNWKDSGNCWIVEGETKDFGVCRYFQEK